MSSRGNVGGGGGDNNDERRHCILFYKYHPLTDDRDVLEEYRVATEALCTSLALTGRILLGLSNDGEGINGTLSGTKGNLDAYVDCMLGVEGGRGSSTDEDDDDLDRRGGEDCVLAFREASRRFFARLDLPELFLDGPDDFKWSSLPSAPSNGGHPGGRVGVAAGGDEEDWFPDLNVKIVREIVSSGGAFSDITVKDTSVGYLTPSEWHREIRALVEKRERRMKRDESSPRGGGGEGDGEGGEEDHDDDDDDDVETVLIDVRNHKECQIGSFAPGISIDPRTKTFAQFPRWVKENSTTNATTSSPQQSLLANKRILMYCTGGIRCEKASAYVRKLVPQNKGIYHLKGGIHKYLEEFGRGGDDDGGGGGGGKARSDECLFVGKNFVFDRRGALDAKGHGAEGVDRADGAPSLRPRSGGANAVVGRCQYCRDPHDVFHPECVCTVCREPVLVCGKCRWDLQREQGTLRGLVSPNDYDHLEDAAGDKITCRAEYHCEDHFHLNKCYFTFLNGFSVADCNEQLGRLRLINLELEGFGRKGKQKRRTLRRQMEKLEAYMRQKLSSDKDENASSDPTMQCRHCGSSTCVSNCWGFHGGNTRMVNKIREDHRGESLEDGGNVSNNVDFGRLKQRSRVPSNQRSGKRVKRHNDTVEIEALQLCSPPSRHRNVSTGMRVPPPVVRTLRSGVKGKWCGKTVSWVLKNEFGDGLRGLTREKADENLEQVIIAGLVRVNGVSVKSSDIVLRNMDTLERIIHWHEPPIIVPQKISLTKHNLPANILPSDFKATHSPILYCINKPSSVPVYPAGPYYANSLLLMVEAQEGMPPKTLIPLHRIDRATSGLLLCANTSSVAGVIQRNMTISSKDNENSSSVRKLYLARVEGKFPATNADGPTIPKEFTSIASIEWCVDDANIIEVNAPIAVQLESNENTSKEDEDQLNTVMHRTVRCDGKHSTSRFKLISYDESTNLSLISCAPITGRGHQLRVHLQLIGFPIHNDVEYGGALNVDCLNDQKNLSAQSMLEVSSSTSEFRHEQMVTSGEVESALRLCKCCSGGLDGIKASFNSAQLLAGGHAIDLHSYKYCVFLQGKGQQRRKQAELGYCSSDERDIINGTTTIEMSTDLPSWATSFVDLMPHTLTWLK